MEALRQLEEWLDGPVALLGFAWLGLLVGELVWGLPLALERLGLAIWAAFVADFSLRFLLAPSKTAYLRTNWLTALSLLAPAARLFSVLRFAGFLRVLKLARAARGLVLLRLVGSLNRTMRGLRATMGRFGFGYAVILIILVAAAGAAGMHALERDGSSAGFRTYGDACGGRPWS